MIFSVLSTLLIVMTVTGTLSAHGTHHVPEAPFRSNGFFLSYSVDEYFGTGELEEYQARYGCAVEDFTTHVTLCDTTWVLEWWEPEDTLDWDISVVMEDLGDIPGIAVTPNYRYLTDRYPDEPVIEIRSPYIEPNDSLFPQQWHMQEDHLDMPHAWSRTRGSRDVIIGILDTGVWVLHEDLRANLWINPGEDLNGDGLVQPREMNGHDDDQNGYVDDFCGWDWVDGDNDPRHPVDDVEFHGTKVAGVTSATTNNGIGVAGVAWNCSMLPLRSGSRQGLYLEDIVPAMLYAIVQEVDILNCSWYNYCGNPVLEKLTLCLYEEGTVVVACAGNGGTNCPAYPASYDWVVAVAATDEEKSLTGFTNYGDWIHLAAPGFSILTTTAYVDSGRLTSYYSFKDGTSFSAPMVSGAAALVKSEKPTWGPGEIAERLIHTSDPILPDDGPPGPTIDGGILNVYRALSVPEYDALPETPDA